MPSDKPTMIALPENFEIGYTSTIATTCHAITLSNGNHFLLARNGRGKTTLLRTLASDLTPRAGSFTYSGDRQYIAEDISFDHHLNAKDIFCALIPKNRRAEATEFAQSIDLNLKLPFGKLSTGNKRKVSLITAEFSATPDNTNVLLLDEPFTGLDAFTRDKFLELWENNKDQCCRLISCHPDFDNMSMTSAVLISPGEISHHTDQHSQTWGELKTLLN